MQEFLTFRKMITPIIIQIIFWIGVVVVVIGGIMQMVNGLVLPGLIAIILGPIFVRIYCELIIILFRIEENTRK